MTIAKFVLLHEADNILVCCQAVEAGEKVLIEDQQYQMKNAIDVGHKIARAHLSKGDKIIRYGVSIGSTTSDIVNGGHVHIHNMKSDYIPSHTRQSLVGA